MTLIGNILHSSRPQRWRQVNQSQFIDGETSFAFSNASSVLIQIEYLFEYLLAANIYRPLTDSSEACHKAKVCLLSSIR